MAILDTILGANVGQLWKDIVGTFKLSPEKKAELQEIADQNQAALDQKQLELQSKAQDAIAAEVKSAADVIKAEAESQSWLPRNVRPLLLLVWGLLITFNYLVPLIARFWWPTMQPLGLDGKVYWLVGTGFTGYVAGRSVEKIFDKN